MAAVAVIVVLVIGAIIVWVVTWKPRITIGGQPTPEDARVKVDAAEEKAKRETETKAEEVRDATLEDNMRRARDLVRRGMHGK